MKNNFYALSFQLPLVLFLFLGQLTCAFASGGRLLATFPETVYFFEKDTKGAEIYASTSKNILVIDPVQQKIIHKIQAWGEPRGLALSMDGKKLYVATSTAQQLMVIDTELRAILQYIALPYLPFDLKLASNGYLYATLSSNWNSGFMQINAMTNQYYNLVGGDYTDISAFSLLEMSPDHRILYIASVGGNYYQGLFKYDVSGNTPNLKDELTKFVGDALDVHLTANGEYFYYVRQAGNGVARNGYDIARIRTSDLSIQGTLITGPYPAAITTSPDGKIAYTYNGDDFIAVWNTETQQKLCSYALETDHESIQKMTTDQSGEYLLVAFLSSLKIYSTGCPEMLANQ